MSLNPNRNINLTNNTLLYIENKFNLTRLKNIRQQRLTLPLYGRNRQGNGVTRAKTQIFHNFWNIQVVICTKINWWAIQRVTWDKHWLYIKTVWYKIITHPRDNISSASSSTNNLIVLARRARRVIMSYTRPGVPTTTCTPLSNWRISSRTLVPPMHAWHFAFKWSPSAITT